MKKIDELILFGVGYLKGRDNAHEKGEMADVLDLEEGTLNRHFTDLRKTGLLTRSDGHGSVYGHDLTADGEGRYASLKDTILDTYLTPEQHHVGSIIALGPYLDFIDDRFNGFEIIARTHLLKEFEVAEIFRKDAILRGESRYLAQIKEGLSIEEDGSSLSIDDMIKAYTRLGIQPGEGQERAMNSDRVWSTLSQAEFLMRSGSLEEAMDLYRQLLSTKAGLNPNQWILAYTRYLKCLLWKGEHDILINNVNWMEPRIKNSVHRAMILELKAMSLSIKKRLDEASSIYGYCLGVYNSKKHPILRASSLNNAAVNFFRQEKFDLADDLWTRAGREARKFGLPWLEAIVYMNMGDNISYHRGQIKRGKDLIRKGRKIMVKLKDQEGIADAYFNEALVCVQEGKARLADKHFLRSLEYPIQDKVRRDERIEVYKERLEKRGMKNSIFLK